MSPEGSSARHLAPIGPPGRAVFRRGVAHRQLETGIRIPAIFAGFQASAVPAGERRDGPALQHRRMDEHLDPPPGRRPAQRITDFTALTVFRSELSPDGRSILMARGTQSSDAFLLTNFR